MAENKVNAAGTSLVRTLPVKLTQSELLLAKDQALAKYREVETVRTQKSSALGGFTEKINKLKAEADELNQVATSGVRMKDVQVREYANYEIGKVVLKREDTLEIVESRPMTTQDRQQRLPIPIDGNADFAPPADIKVSEAQEAVLAMSRKADKAEAAEKTKGNGKENGKAEAAPAKPRPAKDAHKPKPVASKLVH